MKQKTYPALTLMLLAASSLFGDEVRSDLALGVYTCDVSDVAIANTPQWSDLTGDPPLSILGAVRASTARIKTLPASAAPVKWALHRVTLKRNAGKGWYYIATFRSKFVPVSPDDRGRVSSGTNPYKIPRDLNIPVLMNGVVPEISFKRHTDDMIKLLNDLDL